METKSSIEDYDHKSIKEEIKAFNPEVIFVLSGNVVTRPAGKDGKKRLSSSALSDIEKALPEDRGKIVWGKARVVAAAELSDWFPNAEVVTESTSLNNLTGIPDSAVMAEEIEFLSDAENVSELPRSLDTFSELLQAVIYAHRKGLYRSVIVTVAFQLPRAAAMLRSLQTLDESAQRQIEQMLAYEEKKYVDRLNDINYFRELYQEIKKYGDLENFKFKLIPAEEILPLRDSRYAQIVEKARNMPFYQEKLKQDTEGARQWIEGTYGQLN